MLTPMIYLSQDKGKELIDMVTVSKALAEKIKELYNESLGFTKETYVNLQMYGGRVTYSVCALHKATAYDLDYWTMAELNTYYDNYGYSQVNNMVASNEYPLKLSSVWRKANGEECIGIETDSDPHLMELNDVIIMFNEDLKNFKNFVS